MATARDPFANFIHYTAANKFDYHFNDVDATQWHTIGMDWEPGYVTMYLDGVPVWTDTNAAAIPQWNMHLCIQLDAMNAGVLTQPVHMYVDYVRVYQ